MSDVTEGVVCCRNTLRGKEYFNFYFNGRVLATLYVDGPDAFRVMADNQYGQVDASRNPRGTGVVSYEFNDRDAAIQQASICASRAYRHFTGISPVVIDFQDDPRRSGAGVIA